MIEPKPLRVILRNVVHGDFPFGHETWAPPGIYDAYLNPQGAVSITAMNHQALGLRPSEFEWACACGAGVWDARQLRSCVCDFEPGRGTGAS